MLLRRDEGVRICQTRWQEKEKKKKKKKEEQVQRKRKVYGVVWCGVVWVERNRLHCRLRRPTLFASPSGRRREGAESREQRAERVE